MRPKTLLTLLAFTKTASGTPTYTINSGDTLSGIAQRHNTTVAELQKLNNITNPNRIAAGATLHLPSARPQTPTSTQSTRNPYTSKPEDFTHNVDLDFIRGLEGFRTSGYVPNSGHSGVTFGYGVDLGAQNRQSLQRMGIPESSIQQFSPYLGLQQDAARAALRRQPLNVDPERARLYSDKAKAHYIQNIANRFNRATAGRKWNELSPAEQTILSSVLYQYGYSSPTTRTPNFWRYATNDSWYDGRESVLGELRDFQDKHPTRRNLEADYLERSRR